MAIAVHPGNGLDATSAIQAAINTGAANVLIPYASGYDWIVSSPESFTDNDASDDPSALLMVSNQILTLGPGVVLKAKADSFHGKYQALLGAFNKTNVGLVFGAGSRIEMRKSDYTTGPFIGSPAVNALGYANAEWRHCARIVGSSNVNIQGAGEEHLIQSGGDGMEIVASVDGLRTTSSNVEVLDVVMADNHRLGCSITSGNFVTMRRCGFLRSVGTSPRSGLCLEPNANSGDILTNILIDQCFASGNTSVGFITTLSMMGSGHAAVSIIFRNCVASGPGWGYKLDMITGGPPGGTIELIDCTADDVQYAGLRIEWHIDSAIELKFTRCNLRTSALRAEERPIDILLYGSPTGYGIDFSECYVSDLPDRAVINVTSDGGTATNVHGNVYLDRLGDTQSHYMPLLPFLNVVPYISPPLPNSDAITEKFQFYSDYYAFAAEAGLNRARAVYPGITTTTLVDVSTIINRPNSNIATANMTRAFDASYEYLWRDAQNTGSLQDAFHALSRYILEAEGVDINTFITNKNIQVERLYATLANIFGESITESNRKAP